MKRRPEEPFTWGRQKKIYNDSNNPERGIGVFDKEVPNPRRIKGRYYLTKIANLLFPENIPNIRLANSKNVDEIVMDKVQVDEGHLAYTHHNRPKSSLPKD